MANLKELRDERIRKLNELKALGINPYPANTERTNKIGEIIKDFTAFETESVTVAGRIVGIRKFGKLAFIVLKDDSGEIQLFLQKDTVEQMVAEKQQLGMEQLNLLDIGDFIEARGTVIKSKTDEISVDTASLRILSKSLRQMPDKQQGFTDIESRYRQRYVDMQVNSEVKKDILLRSKVTEIIRQFLIKNEFIEVETPVLQPVYGGASARPFTTYHHKLESDFYLRVSPELYLKKAVVGGIEKVFEFARNFRNEGIDRSHNPEFTMLEFYWAYANYNDLMDLTEELISDVLMNIFGGLKFEYQGETLDFTAPYKRYTFREIILEKTEIDIDKISKEDLLTEIKKRNIEVNQAAPMKDLLDEFYKETCRKDIVQPIFLTDYPMEMIPLAKRKEDNPKYIASMQLVCSGFELIKAYNELNDPVDQLDRLSEDQKSLDDGTSDESMKVDVDFIRALEIGLPPTAGWGMGIDRFVSFLANKPAIKDVIMFPTLKPEDVDEVTKKIYPDISFEENNRSKQDFTKRIVLVVNQDIQNWQVANAASHMSAYLGRSINHFDTGEFFETKDNQKYPRNTQYPIVIKVASSEELRTLYSAAEDAKLSHHGFIQEMIETTNDTKIEKILAEKMTDDVLLYGVGLFGDDEKTKNLTDKFALWSGSGDEKPQLSSLPESAVVHGTKKLYLDDWAKLDFSANVIAVSKNGEAETVVVLDQTAFYPGGGGQPNDLGEIKWDGGSLKLSSVSKDEAGIVYHAGEVDGVPPSVELTVNGFVSREPRELHNRLHCAGHLIDYGVKQAGLDWKSGISAHFPERCYVNYSGEVSADDYESLKQKIEASVNSYIKKGGAVTAIVVPSEKAHEVSEYIPQAVLESYQNVHIAQYPDNFNICCGGTHVQDVSEIGEVKITKIKKKNGQIRVSYEVS